MFCWLRYHIWVFSFHHSSLLPFFIILFLCFWFKLMTESYRLFLPTSVIGDSCFFWGWLESLKNSFLTNLFRFFNRTLQIINESPLCCYFLKLIVWFKVHEKNPQRNQQFWHVSFPHVIVYFDITSKI